MNEILDELIKSIENSHAQVVDTGTSSQSKESTANEAAIAQSSNDSKTSSNAERASTSSNVVAATSSNCEGAVAAASSGNANTFFFVKWIEFQNQKTPIILQNENGPCPLLSICNVLLLRGQMQLEPNVELIENEKLIQILANILFNECVPRFLARKSGQNAPNQQEQIDFEQNISDALHIFGRLQYGLDVNVKFSDCNAFEYTRELDIFDLFLINLYHGWLIDPEQTEFHRLLAAKSYNQLVEMSINFSQMNESAPDYEQKAYAKLLADNFLELTASQLTDYGLSVIHSTMFPNELAILFRNNHFSTVYMHPTSRKLYTLVTDNGYLSHANIVWETLDSIEGAGRFCDFNFRDIFSSADNYFPSAYTDHSKLSDNE